MLGKTVDYKSKNYQKVEDSETNRAEQIAFILCQIESTKINQAHNGQNDEIFFIHQVINISVHLCINNRILCNNQEEFQLLV